MLNVSALHRFDSKVSSHINKEVEVFNRKLKKKKGGIWNHKGIINISSNKKHHRKYRLHVNMMRKKGITNRTAAHVIQKYISKF
jgi:hypothetical protein